MKTFFAVVIALSCTLGVNAQVGAKIERWAGQGLNPVFNTGAPVGLASQNIIYFVSPLFDEKAGNLIDKIAYSTRNIDGTWSDPVHLKSPLNDVFNNTVVGIDSTGMRLYLLGRYSKNPGARIGLSSSAMVNGFWLDPETVKLKGLNPATEYYSIYVTPDEKFVFATFERRFSRKEDLYFAKRESNSEKFSKLKRLPQPINSKQSEISPFYHTGDSILYFAREVGDGDSANYDLFKSRALNAELTVWSEPEPMQALNSPGFEAYFWKGMDGLAFFTSDQFNFGRSDILTYNENPSDGQLAKAGLIDNSLGDAAGIQAKAINTDDKKEVQTENFSMIKILDRDEMLLELSSAGDEVPSFELSAVLKDTTGKSLPPGVLFNVKSGAGDVLRSDFTDDSGAVKVSGIPIREDLKFEVADEAYQQVDMEVLNKKGEVTAVASMDEMKEFIFEKLEAEQAAIALIKNLEDPRLSNDMINKFLTGEMASLSVDKELGKSQGLVPTITEETMIALAVKGMVMDDEIDLVEFIDDDGNVIKTLDPTDNKLAYQDVEDVKCQWIRINGGALMALDNQIRYLRAEDVFEIICSPIEDPNTLADIEAKVLAREREARNAIAASENTDTKSTEDADAKGDLIANVDRAGKSVQANDASNGNKATDANGNQGLTGLKGSNDGSAEEQANATIESVNDSEVANHSGSSKNTEVSDNELVYSSDKEMNAQADDSGSQQVKVAGVEDTELRASKLAGNADGDKQAIDFLYDIYFGFDQSTLDERALLQLERLKVNGALSPKSIEGGADTIGPAAYNQVLSERRASAVASALNVSSSVTVKGNGEQACLGSAEARKVSIGIAVNQNALASTDATTSQTSSMIVYHRLEEALPESQYLPLLNEVAAYLVANPQVGLRIKSHTDHRGSSDYNVTLSMRRAQHVQSFMNGKGVNQNQLRATWFGETQLASGCADNNPCANASKSKDRRTELSFYNLD